MIVSDYPVLWKVYYFTQMHYYLTITTTTTTFDQAHMFGKGAGNEGSFFFFSGCLD